MHLDSFILSALLLLAVTSIAVAFCRQVGLGSILGLLVAGIIVGPHSPGPYITEHVEDVRNFTELGVVLLLFVIGLEVHPSRLWSLRRDLFGLGSLQILLTGLVIAVYVWFSAQSWETALIIGLTLSLSSTAFIMQQLQERGEFASKHGSCTFAILMMQDLAVVPLLALLPLLSDVTALSSKTSFSQQLLILIAMFIMLWLFGRKVVPLSLEWLARHNNRDAFLLVVFLSVFFAAWAMHQAGLSMALGAFLMGMLLADSNFNTQIRAYIEPYKGLLMSLFFVAVGMSIDLGELAKQPLDFIEYSILLICIKLAVLFPLALLFGYSRSDSVRIAFYLAQAGEFGFVLFGSALVLNVIDNATFIMAVGVISMSMLATPIMVKIGDKLARNLEQSQRKKHKIDSNLVNDAKQKKVLICGYGRMGHTIAMLLESSGVPFIAFDTNAERIAQGIAQGHIVLYGDFSNPELLMAAHVERCSLVIITSNFESTALKTVSHLQIIAPHVPIIARAKDLEACGRLTQAGVTEAFPEVIEASLRVGSKALQMVGPPNNNIDRLIRGVREDDYQLVREPNDEN